MPTVSSPESHSVRSCEVTRECQHRLAELVHGRLQPLMPASSCPPACNPLWQWACYRPGRKFRIPPRAASPAILQVAVALMSEGKLLFKRLHFNVLNDEWAAQGSFMVMLKPFRCHEINQASVANWGYQPCKVTVGEAMYAHMVGHERRGVVKFSATFIAWTTRRSRRYGIRESAVANLCQLFSRLVECLDVSRPSS